MTIEDLQRTIDHQLTDPRPVPASEIALQQAILVALRAQSVLLAQIIIELKRGNEK